MEQVKQLGYSQELRFKSIHGPEITETWHCRSDHGAAGTHVLKLQWNGPLQPSVSQVTRQAHALVEDACDAETVGADAVDDYV